MHTPRCRAAGALSKSSWPRAKILQFAVAEDAVSLTLALSASAQK